MSSKLVAIHYDEENAAMKLLGGCQRGMNFYDKKLMAFATKHGIETKPCTTSSEYRTAATCLDVSKD